MRFLDKFPIPSDRKRLNFAGNPAQKGLPFGPWKKG